MKYIYIISLLYLIVPTQCMTQPNDHVRDVNMLEKEIDRNDFNAASFNDTVIFVLKEKEYRRIKKEQIRADWGKVKALFKGTDYVINPFTGKIPAPIALGSKTQYLELKSHKYIYIIGMKAKEIVCVYEVKIEGPADAPPH